MKRSTSFLLGGRSHAGFKSNWSRSVDATWVQRFTSKSSKVGLGCDYMSHHYNLRWAVCGQGVSLAGSSFRVPYSGGNIGIMKAEKILSEHPQGLHARIDLCILKFVGTISCERKVCGEGMPLPATNTGECLAQQRTFSGRLLPNSLV
jgi:hypothetical protein